MLKFNWLHLTDFHLGMSGQDHLWPNVRQKFLEDLKRMHDTCGSFHAVFFTGDFVQKGSSDEFNRLNDELERIWKAFGKLESNPVLFTVPGNHDLVWPGNTAATLALTRLWDQPEVQGEFWDDETSEYRSLIKGVFQNYETWSNDCELRRTPVQTGIIPGDFSSTLEVNGLKIGVVGLNTTFLQLTKDDYEGKLAWDSRQLHHVCGEGPPAWVDRHHICFLLTHHGPEWLNDQSKKAVYGEINPAGRFAVHLFGHMHEHEATSISTIGASSRRTWQGCSLFGLEHFGDEQKENRRHGYSVGQVKVNGEEGQLRFWPRLGKRSIVDGWWISPDTEVGKLESDNGTPPALIAIQTPALNDPIEEVAPPPVDESQEGPEVRRLREQLSIYRNELTKAEDPAQKINLRRLIHELQKKISGDDKKESESDET